MKVAFGELRQDPNAPVEVSADSLSVDQNDGSAVFSGNVLIVQGNMRMAAPKVHVHYNDETSGIAKLVATGGVTVVNGADAAEAQTANYQVEDGVIVMIGDVLLTQGNNALSTEKMTVNLDAGTAQMDGRVKTVLKPEGNN
jgi:lipopolysaccharide export system protein LptA